MKGSELKVPGAFEFIPDVFADSRGMFTSPFQQTAFIDAVGRPLFPVRQTNSTASKKNTFRGIHFTKTPPGSAKYVYCTRGQALDYLVDLRAGSPTFGAWDSVVLDADRGNAIYVPNGLGHAYLALTEDTRMTYLVSGEYVPDNELSIRGDDEKVGLGLRLDDYIVSDRDLRAMSLEDATTRRLLPPYDVSRAADGAVGT